MANLDPEIQKLVDQRVQEALKASGMTMRRNRMTIVASKGTMDMAYIPLILSSTAVAMEMEAAIFFTFYGLYILHKERGKHLQVAPLGNPASPLPVPNIVGAIPGMTAMATMMMKSWIAKVKVPTISELLAMCQEGGVKLIACQMTMDLLGIEKKDLIDGIEIGGAATYLGYASESSITLLV